MHLNVWIDPNEGENNNKWHHSMKCHYYLNHDLHRWPATSSQVLCTLWEAAGSQFELEHVRIRLRVNWERHSLILEMVSQWWSTWDRNDWKRNPWPQVFCQIFQQFKRVSTPDTFDPTACTACMSRFTISKASVMVIYRIIFFDSLLCSVPDVPRSSAALTKVAQSVRNPSMAARTGK